MVQPCAKGEDFKTHLDKFSEEAAKLGRTKNTTFVEILYAMVMNASSNVPSALHWSEDGSSFVVESAVRLFGSSRVPCTSCILLTLLSSFLGFDGKIYPRKILPIHSIPKLCSPAESLRMEKAQR